jgi:lipid-A-disaccharide synthase-like uncharacterized protein
MNLPTTPLMIFGFAGQALFSARFIVQWIASEAKKQSVIPLAFWYFSLGGGLFLTIYAILRHDPVFILGQAAGLVVYVRNLILISRQRRQTKLANAQPAS